MPSGRFGLIIASYQYDDPGLRRLIAPARDAEALAEVLGDPRIGGFDVDTMINRPSYEVAQRIEGFFSDRHRDDLLLLYFSGHGLKDSRGRLYLAMSNTKRRMLNATAIPAIFVREALDQSRSRQNVLLLDCCYSGAFAKGMTPKADPYSVHTRDRFAAAGSVVLTASDALQYSFEDDSVSGSGVESVFTRILVEGLTSGEADRDLDGDIGLDELYDYIHDRVAEERPEQQPCKWAWDVHGRIVIARNPHWTLPSCIQQILASPFPGMRLGAVDELVHLARIGNDVVFTRARQALEQLTTDDSRKVCQAATGALTQLNTRPEVTQRVRCEVEEWTETVKTVALLPPPPTPMSEPTANEEPHTTRMRWAVMPSRRSDGSVVSTTMATVLHTLIPRFRTRIGAVLVPSATVMLIGAIMAVLLIWQSSREIVVPHVTGDAATVTARLRDAGFTVLTIEAPADVPRGQVIRTVPAANMRVKRHSVITLYVSSGPQVVVPAVSGAADAATAKLRAAGFKVRKVTEANTKVQSGSVTRTMPRAGAKADRGSEVTLYVSSGNSVKVPDVANQPRAKADALIRAAGFKVDHWFEYSNAFPTDVVIRTSPKSGTTAAHGATVTEVVSQGSAPQIRVSQPGQTQGPVSPSTYPPPTVTIPTPPGGYYPVPPGYPPGYPPPGIPPSPTPS